MSEGANLATMSVIKSIAKNTTWLMASQVVNAVLGLLYLRFTINYLGAGQWGTLSFAFSLTTILAVLLDMGTNMMITREVARNRAMAWKYISNITVIKLVASLLMLAIVA